MHADCAFPIFARNVCTRSWLVSCGYNICRKAVKQEIIAELGKPSLFHDYGVTTT